MGNPAAALHAAVHAGDERAVARLLRAGASPEATDDEGVTALYTAAADGRSAVVRLLLASGAAPDRLSGDGESPLCGAACWGRTDAVRELLAAGAAPDLAEEFGHTASTWAVRGGHTAVLAELLAAGADPDRPMPPPGGEPLLVAAVRRGSPGCVRLLFAHGAAARPEALAEARRLSARDVEAELRGALERAHGPGHSFTTRRFTRDGGGRGLGGDAVGVVEVTLLRDGRPAASDDRETGQAEVLALLEAGPGPSGAAPAADPSAPSAPRTGGPAAP
ncbi:ankyrin repeat domain-containing protein [Streptomyces fructofermentans]|uniref:Ankyrin repeat domain-containing protein n=1 Tax=Streptomyces fructofermentans TaxID=152141 RepID=A0A918KF41_9ACTN|nr:ankyrin repeat domain-containing protein [Streptomyces fructofermentans]GGX61067.1 hypothetical protein GCM10010515_31080 [Streptomyces fructofermentans]